MRAQFKKAAKAFGAFAATAATAALACPTIAFADEGGGISAILPDMNEFIPMLVAFIVLAIVLWKFGWPLLDGILEKRAATIEDSLKKSEEAREEAERTLAEYKKQLEETRAQSAAILADAKQAGEAVKADIEAKAQAEAALMIEKAKAAIEAEKKSAIAELQGSAADLSISVASRLIGEDLSDDEHRKIIERYVNEAGSFNAN